MIGAILFLFFIPFIIFCIIAFLITLPDRISAYIIERKIKRYKQTKKQNILNEKEEKRIKEKWIDDFRSGNQVRIGEALIQYENNTLKINGESIFIKEIQNLEFTYKILSVLEKTIDTYSSSDAVSIYPELAWHSPVYDNFGNVKRTYKMTFEEYNKKMVRYIDKDRIPHNKYELHLYEFEKEYYLSITFNNGKQENYLIGNVISKFEKNCDYEGNKFKEMTNQVKYYISKSEEEKQWINNLKNGNTVQIGNTTIHYKNNALIINENSILIKEIQNLELAEKVLNVWKNTLDMKQYLESAYSRENPNFGKIINREKINFEQYKITTEYGYSYDIENEYYISITLNNGEHTDYLISHSISHYEKNKKIKEKFEEMINEIKYAIKI